MYKKIKMTEKEALYLLSHIYTWTPHVYEALEKLEKAGFIKKNDILEN